MRTFREDCSIWIDFFSKILLLIENATKTHLRIECFYCCLKTNTSSSCNIYIHTSTCTTVVQMALLRTKGRSYPTKIWHESAVVIVIIVFVTLGWWSNGIDQRPMIAFADIWVLFVCLLSKHFLYYICFHTPLGPLHTMCGSRIEYIQVCTVM